MVILGLAAVDGPVRIARARSRRCILTGVRGSVQMELPLKAQDATAGSIQ